MSDIKTVILDALARYRGDDLERAKAAFRGCTPKQIAEVWSGNGETRQQVLDGYQRHADLVREAVQWVKENVR